MIISEGHISLGTIGARKRLIRIALERSPGGHGLSEHRAVSTSSPLVAIEETLLSLVQGALPSRAFGG